MYPIHLNLGFRIFHFYEGFYFLVAIGLACWFGARRLKAAGLDVDLFLESVPWILAGAVLCARLFHFAFWDRQSFLDDPTVFFRFWDGGLTITGGLAGGALAALACFRRARVDFWAYAAALSPAVLLGQAIGRIGCFLNGDAWGIPTRLPWGVALPRFGTLVPGLVQDRTMSSSAWEWCVASGYAGPASLATVPLHPTQLYECLADLLLAALVIRLVRALRRRRAPLARALWLHLAGYSLLRFGLEFLHGDRDALVWSGMTALQLGLLAFGILGGVLWLRSGSAPAEGRT